MRNVPHRLLYLNSQSQAGGTLWGDCDLWDVTLSWKKFVIEGDFGVLQPAPLQFMLSGSCLQLKM